MKRTLIKDDKVYIVENEIISDSIMPKVKKELSRNVKLYGKTIVEGALFASELLIEGSFVYIGKSVNANDSIIIKSKDDSMLWFNSIVNAGHSIMVERQGEGRVRFSNAISSQKINLSNAIVYGNIFCDDLILEDCVVLGGVFCQNKLTVKNSIMGSYDAGKITIESDSGLILPFGISDETPTFHGKMYSVFAKDFSQDLMFGIYQIMNQEVYPVKEDEKERHVLSPFMRIFDFSLLNETIGQNLTRLSYYTSKEIDAVEEDHEVFKAFDESFFRIIDTGFMADKVLPMSNFMNLADDIINDFLATQKSEFKSD